jgi:ribosomal protein S18 acetylase RimI-like enzyme
MTSAVALEPVGGPTEFLLRRGCGRPESQVRIKSQVRMKHLMRAEPQVRTRPQVRTEANAPEPASRRRRPVPGLSIVQPAQFATLRAIWLRALEDSPNSFAADPYAEAAVLRTVWRRSIAESTWILAWVDEQAVGLARCIADPEDPTGRYIESVWVDPRFRRNGLVAAMLHRLETRARAKGATRFRLWVLDGNSNAMDAYKKLGFAEDGKTSFITMPPGGGLKLERRMAKDLL